MNTDKLRQMYESGGLLRSILKDPKMRQMAASMLASNTHSVIDGSAGRGGMMKYEDGGMVEMSEQVTEQIGPRYSGGKKEWAVSPHGVRWIANEMDKRGIGFRSDEATKTLMEIMKKNPEAGLDIIDYAFSAAAEYGRNPDSAPEREYSSDFLPTSVPGYRTTVTNGASDYR